MPLFVSILEGETPSQARAIMATRDPRIVDAVCRAVVECLRPQTTPKRILELVCDRDRSGPRQPEGA